MALSHSQLTTLKSDILADQVLSQIPNTTDGAFEISAAYNATAVPAFMVWRQSIEINTIMSNGFDWTVVDNLSVGKSRIWDWMTRVGSINPSLANVRSGIVQAFSVSGAADDAMRVSIFGHCAKLASRGEKLFSTGTGVAANDQGVGPATTQLSSPISFQDVIDARNLP
jgi:hypothetical protein